jgi:hypothetical protein
MKTLIVLDATFWERLVAVTHWMQEDVAREQELVAHRARPTSVVKPLPDLPGVLSHLDHAPVAVRGQGIERLAR